MVKSHSLAEAEQPMINYLVLVNKEKKLPEKWEDIVVLLHTTNSLGNDIEVEKETYEAYLKLCLN